MRHFEIGDVVQLKSGGPHMTIEFIRLGKEDAPDMADCTWFNLAGSLALQRDTFRLDSLVSREERKK